MSENRRSFIGEHKVVSGLVAVVLGLGAVGVGDYVSVASQTDRQPVPAGSCESPFFVTHRVGDPEASSVSQYFGGRNGIVMHVNVGGQAIGVRAAYKSPDAAEWGDVSDMLPVNELGQATLTLAIGKGDVDFGVQTVAQDGSPACRQAPMVAVEIQDVGEYSNRPGQTPWANPGEYLTNLGISAPPV